MSYQVLSRKWRPQRFDEVVGQIHITRTLQNAIEMDRVAHSYLFSGPRGVGKTSTARILSKALNCKNSKDKNPCNQCSNCIDITKGSSLDVQELDGASNRGIDEIRGLREAVKYPPNSSEYRIYIIDEVHMLTREAFNALLKTLEEPPAHIIFIMATTDAHKLPATILSRTQKFDFKPISVNDISTYLQGILDNEKMTYEDDGIHLIAQKADGSLRDSLSILDQVIAYAGETLNVETVREVLGIIEENVFLDVLQLINDKKHQELISYISKLLNDGFSISDFISGFNDYIRYCMLCIDGDSKIYNLSKNSINWLNSCCRFSTIDLLRMLDLSLQFESNLKNIPQPQISLEALFMKLSLLENSIDIAKVLSDNNNLNINVKQTSTTPTIPNEKFNLPEKDKAQPSTEKVSSVKKTISMSEPNTKSHPKLTLELIKQSWPEIINELEKQNSKIAHFLENALLNKFDGEKLWIELLDGHRFQQITLEKDVEQIEAVMNRIFNKIIQIKFQMKDASENKPKQKKPENEEHPLFDKVLETFEGEIIR